VRYGGSRWVAIVVHQQQLLGSRAIATDCQYWQHWQQRAKERTSFADGQKQPLTAL